MTHVSKKNKISHLSIKVNLNLKKNPPSKITRQTSLLIYVGKIDFPLQILPPPPVIIMNDSLYCYVIGVPGVTKDEVRRQHCFGADLLAPTMTVIDQEFK